MKRAFLWLGIVILIAFLVFVGLNLNSLDDGVAYLRDMFAYTETPAQALSENGRFGFCYQFVTLRNAQRAQFIENYLDARGIAFQRLPINDTDFANIFVPLTPTGPFTIYSAHYDKIFDEPDYQGASDNSAAVCMLLVAAAELDQQRAGGASQKPIAFLFTGEEERGLVGAQAFYEYATANNIPVGELLNFDSMGRAGIAARASGDRSGFVFTIPFLGEFVYDGRTLARASTYSQPDPQVIERLRRLVPITAYDRMVAKSDGTYWQDHGWNAINFTSDNIYYLNETWHTYGDIAQLLDETNFDRAVTLMLEYARQDR